MNIVSKLFIIWISIVLIVTTILIKEGSTDKKFYRIGPYNDFYILGIAINTGSKYFGVVLYSFINSGFRAIFRNYLQPWMINNVQDEKRDKTELIKYDVYEIAAVSVIYAWVDWFLYMNILLSQADMVVVEICADLMMSLIITTYYLGVKYELLLPALFPLSSRVE